MKSLSKNTSITTTVGYNQLFSTKTTPSLVVAITMILVLLTITDALPMNALMEEHSLVETMKETNEEQQTIHHPQQRPADARGKSLIRRPRLRQRNLKFDPQSIMFQVTGTSGAELPLLSPKGFNEHVLLDKLQEMYPISEESSSYPLVINIGQGTTGTHSYFEATCDPLNLSTFHWGLVCLPSSSDINHLSLPEVIALTHHLKMKTIENIWAWTCLPGPHSLNNDGYSSPSYAGDDVHHVDPQCTFEATQRYMNELKLSLRLVIEMNVRYGAVQALHDSPYSIMVPYLMELIQEQGKGDASASSQIQSIMSQRDPYEWTQSRLKGHARTTIFCRDMFVLSINDGKEFEPMPSNDIFDLIGCLDRVSDKTLTKFSDVFVNVPLLLHEATLEFQGLPDSQRRLEERRAMIYHRVEEGYDKFQNKLYPTVWEYNLFEDQNHKVSSEELALNMVPNLTHVVLPITTSTVTMTTYDEEFDLEGYNFAKQVVIRYDDFLQEIMMDESNGDESSK